MDSSAGIEAAQALYQILLDTGLILRGHKEDDALRRIAGGWKSEGVDGGQGGVGRGPVWEGNWRDFDAARPQATNHPHACHMHAVQFKSFQYVLTVSREEVFIVKKTADDTRG